MNFRKLVFEYQDNIDVNMKETLEELQNYLKEDEIIMAVSLMNDLKEPQLTRAKKQVESSLRRLMREANSKAMKLNQNSDRSAYNEIQEFCNQLIHIKDYI